MLTIVVLEVFEGLILFS